MVVLTLENIHLAYGNEVIFDDIDLKISAGERVCLLGRNGAGKSTLLKVIAGEIQADSGQLRFSDHCRIASLKQDVPNQSGLTVHQAFLAANRKVASLMAEYESLLKQLEDNPEEQSALARLSEVQHQLEASHAWQFDNEIRSVASRLNLSLEAKLEDLSGGQQRRVMLGCALAQKPELLLLDEPTNHLDIYTIDWLEKYLNNYNGTVIFTTHDRAFLQNVANKIVELELAKLKEWPGDYHKYLEGKQHQLEVEQKQQALFDKKLSQEEAWIRQGIKARRTRNEGRVRALKELRKQRVQRRERVGKANISLEQAKASGQLVVEAKNISYSYGDKPLIRDFSTTIMRGDRVGVIGPNGAGKTTLINLLLGQLQPDSGEIKLGTKLELAYFDQRRMQLDPEKNVVDNLELGTDTVTIEGKSKHVVGYLQDFLFSPQRIFTPVRSLSGGERNRLLLAKLFTKAVNLLVLDEPTNDLDVETLELLEEMLSQYQGTLILVSHDRAFFDNVVTQSIAFENGEINEYVGGYYDWLRQSPYDPFVSFSETANKTEADARSVAVKNDSNKAADKTTPKLVTKKLSYKEQRELDQLPQLIEDMEEEKSAIESEINNAAFYQGDQEQIKKTLARLEALGQQLTQAYERWEQLE